ncbi:MAG: hypothetical protein NTV62_04055 [Candidatus Gribaldobacteria bacterium]|nr:hypothetical protein [Candidatus Gribaldobacteria bacterium]
MATRVVLDDSVVLNFDSAKQQIKVVFAGEEEPTEDKTHYNLIVLLEGSELLKSIISGCKEGGDLENFREILNHISSACYQAGTGIIE